MTVSRAVAKAEMTIAIPAVIQVAIAAVAVMAAANSRLNFS